MSKTEKLQLDVRFDEKTDHNQEKLNTFKKVKYKSKNQK